MQVTENKNRLTRFEKYKINNLSHRRRIQCGDGALYVSYRI
jgi:hypothetical protein